MRKLLPLLLLLGCHASGDGLSAELADTGLYDPETRAYAPAWDAWSDGAEKVALDPPAGRHLDRRQPARRLDLPRRHAAVEGVPARRQEDRDPHAVEGL